MPTVPRAEAGKYCRPLMSTRSYDKGSFPTEFFPDENDRAEVEIGAQRTAALSRGHHQVVATTPPAVVPEPQR